MFWTSPIIPWSLIAGTLTLTAIRQRMLNEETLPAELQTELSQEPLREASQLVPATNALEFRGGETRALNANEEAYPVKG
jgi:hypothetical protein